MRIRRDMQKPKIVLNRFHGKIPCIKIFLEKISLFDLQTKNIAKGAEERASVMTIVHMVNYFCESVITQ